MMDEHDAWLTEAGTCWWREVDGCAPVMDAEDDDTVGLFGEPDSGWYYMTIDFVGYPELGRAIDAALEAGGELAKAITALLAIPDPALGKNRADRWDALRRVQAALAAHGAAVVRLHEVAR